MRRPAEEASKRNKAESLKEGLCLLLKKGEKIGSKEGNQKVGDSETKEGGTKK